MGPDCDEFICSKDDLALMQQIQSKANVGGRVGVSKDDPSLKYQYKGPLNSVLLGKHGWPVLHAFTLRYPEKPTDEDKERFKKFIQAFSWTYPCSNCATDFRREIADTPPKLENRKSLALWL